MKWIMLCVLLAACSAKESTTSAQHCGKYLVKAFIGSFSGTYACNRVSNYEAWDCYSDSGRHYDYLYLQPAVIEIQYGNNCL